MSPCTISLDDQTTMHFWTPNRRQLNKPTLVLIHGYGGNSRWQFFTQEEQLKKIGRNVFDLIVPEKAQDMRPFMNSCIYKSSPFKLIPNFFLMGFVQTICKKNRKEKLELAEHMLSQKADPNLPILTKCAVIWVKKTLLIWGEKDNIFPVFLAHQLQRHLGPKSRLAILKDSGHAVNIDSPNMVNELIKSFVLG
uniref:Uncharacterized protein n=1 Tax=Quercus lobata TaxID=97700 RepID=A0A7N2R462_QUELO